MQIKSFSTPGEYVAHGVRARNQRGEFYEGHFSVWFNINGTIHDAEWFARGFGSAGRKPTAKMMEQIGYDMGMVMRRADILADL